MQRLMAIAGLILSLGLQGQGLAASCPGDCGGEGNVTVDELLLGVNIALGNVPLSLCSAMDSGADGAVTVDELLTAVNAALNGCPFTGRYVSQVALDGGQTGSLDMNVESTGHATGTLLITDGDTARVLRFGSAGGAAAGPTISLSGSVNLSTGAFSISGSYLDGQGHTIPINVGGTLPASFGGSGTVNFQIGPNSFSASITNANAPTPTPTPTATATFSGTLHKIAVGKANSPFDPEFIEIDVGDTVEWMWVSGPHSVQSGAHLAGMLSCTPDGRFDSGVQSSGTFRYTFTTVGEYEYHCGVAGHCENFESAIIVVRGTPTPIPTATQTPTRTPTATPIPTLTPTPETIAGASTAMLGIFSGQATSGFNGAMFPASIQIQADTVVTVTELPTAVGNVLGGGSFTMVAETPTRLTYHSATQFPAISLTLELVGPGHVTGTYTNGSPGMGTFTITLDLTRAA